MKTVVCSTRTYNRLLMIEKLQGTPEKKKKKKSNAGRPTVMTKRTLDKLKEAFLMDCTDTEACLNAEIAVDTLYKYQRENPGYIKQKAVWKDNPFLVAHTTLLRGIKEDADLALKYMKNKKNKEFSEKNGTEHSGEVGVTMQITNFSTQHDKDE